MRFTTKCLLALILAAVAASPVDACTRYLTTNKLGVFAARTMDWPESTEPVLTVFPRGMQRDGGMLGGVAVVKDNPAKWTSKYGSLVTTVYGLGAADGINEKGLAGHLLFLNAADYGQRDPSKPGVHGGFWLQYLLDQAATVEEAVKLLDEIQPVMVEARGHKSTVHVAIEDASGDSAIIEYVGGKRVIHHGKQYQIMTNDPPYDQQLALLSRYDFSKPSSDVSVPGNVKATDRFVRTAYFGAMLPEPANEREAVANMLAIARNASVPFGAPYKGFGIYNTEYRTVTNLTKRLYYFELTTSPNVVWIDLSKLNFDTGAPVMMLKPDDINLWGDVSDKLTKAEKSPY